MYFKSLFFNLNKKKEWINSRKKRKCISNHVKPFSRGDIITITFWHKSYNYYFEGLCLGLKHKTFNNPNVTLF